MQEKAFEILRRDSISRNSLKKAGECKGVIIAPKIAETLAGRNSLKKAGECKCLRKKHFKEVKNEKNRKVAIP